MTDTGAGKRFFPDRVRLRLELVDEHGSLEHAHIFRPRLDAGLYVVVAYDEVKGAAQWLDGAAESVGKPSTSHGLSPAVLVGQYSNGRVPNYLKVGNVALVVDHDLYRPAEKVIASF